MLGERSINNRGLRKKQRRKGRKKGSVCGEYSVDVW